MLAASAHKMNPMCFTRLWMRSWNPSLEPTSAWKIWRERLQKIQLISPCFASSGFAPKLPSISTFWCHKTTATAKTKRSPLSNCITTPTMFANVFKDSIGHFDNGHHHQGPFSLRLACLMLAFTAGEFFVAHGKLC